jgi:nuclear pore complex protein Nup93
MEDEWEETKRELVSYFSQNEMMWSNVGRADGVSGWGQQGSLPSDARRLNAAFALAGEVSESMKRKMLEYARRILELNERRKQKQPYPLAFRLGQASLSVGTGDASQKAIKNCWDLVQSIMSEDVNPTSGESKSDPTLEAEYSSQRGPQGSLKVPVLKHWLQGSCHFLEEQYHSYIETFVRTQRVQAQVGSMPGREQTIAGFVHALLYGKPHWDRCEKPDNKNPIWAQIYYSLRSGQLDAASTFARQLGDKSPFYNWFSHWKSDPNHTLPQEIANQVQSEYRKLSSHDPYKSLVFNLIGQCDPMRSHDDIYKFATEDYMWFKLNMVIVDDVPMGSPALLAAVASSASSPSFGMPSSATPAFTLSHFQQLITSYGPDHFSNPLLYFQILMLSLQFETAIQFLESTGQFPVETLHFALALYYYGALHIPDQPLTAPLMGHQQKAPFWNIVRHLTQYVRNFEDSNVLASLNYLYIIRQENVRNLCIRDLLTDTEQFSLLLGDVHPDGTRQPGYLEAFVSQNDWREIVSLAATAYEQAGKYEDAMSLFDAAMYYDKVVELITKQLSRILTGNGPERQRLIEYAAARYEKYDRDPSRGPLQELRGDKAWAVSLASFRMLLQLCDFIDLYHSAKYHEALDTIANLGLLPFENAAIETCTANFKNVSDPVRRNFAEILLAAMTCLYRMFIQIKDEGLNAEREAFLRSLKLRAKALVTFTGLINFRMPADTQSRLVRMEASMT